jgi:hypothetical protein
MVPSTSNEQKPLHEIAEAFSSPFTPFFEVVYEANLHFFLRFLARVLPKEMAKLR